MGSARLTDVTVVAQLTLYHLELADDIFLVWVSSGQLAEQFGLGDSNTARRCRFDLTSNCKVEVRWSQSLTRHQLDNS
jgi:hypothetical protein